MFGIDIIGNFDPVVFTIGDDESDGGEYDASPAPMSLEQFYQSAARSIKSLEETHNIMRAYHCRLMQKSDGLEPEIGEKDRRLEELRGRKKTLEGIRDQLVAAVRCVERKVVQTYYATVSRMRVLREKQDFLQSLKDMPLKNLRMEAKVERLHRRLAIKLKARYNI